MSKNREQQKADREKHLFDLRLQMRQAYKEGNTEKANKIMDEIRSLSHGKVKSSC